MCSSNIQDFVIVRKATKKTHNWRMPRQCVPGRLFSPPPIQRPGFEARIKHAENRAQQFNFYKTYKKIDLQKSE